MQMAERFWEYLLKTMMFSTKILILLIFPCLYLSCTVLRKTDVCNNSEESLAALSVKWKGDTLEPSFVKDSLSKVIVGGRLFIGCARESVIKKLGMPNRNDDYQVSYVFEKCNMLNGECFLVEECLLKFYCDKEGVVFRVVYLCGNG